MTPQFVRKTVRFRSDKQISISRIHILPVALIIHSYHPWVWKRKQFNNKLWFVRNILLNPSAMGITLVMILPIPSVENIRIEYILFCHENCTPLLWRFAVGIVKCQRWNLTSRTFIRGYNPLWLSIIWHNRVLSL